MGKHFGNKHFSKKRGRKARAFETAEIIEFQHSKFEAERTLPPLLPLNAAQATYINALQTSHRSSSSVPPAPARPGWPPPTPPISSATA